MQASLQNCVADSARDQLIAGSGAGGVRALFIHDMSVSFVVGNL